jgi:acetylornithine deacetylase/succinyl-diaminopimelate desuccinylase-like protein
MDHQVLDYLKTNREVFIEDLQELVRIPSIASQNTGMEESVQWMETYLRKIGIEPIIERDVNFPVFLIEIEGESPHAVLVYGHYDVQPVQEDLWDYAPFGAEIVDGRMYGRGTVDDKAQILAPLEAVRAYLECGKKPPLTVKFLLEGEEEVGSPSLKPVLEKYRDFLDCDALINYDDSVWFDGRPRVVCGLKGALSLKFIARTNREYHGMMFSMMPGAIWRLVWALGSLVDTNGKILVKDFYDDVVAPTDIELRAVEDLNWDASTLREEAGITEFLGGKDTLAAVQSFVFDTTMGLGGIAGGYVYPERKGVVPAYATAEMRIGLVPNQTAERVFALVRQHLDENGFEDIELEYARTGNPWARTPIDSPLALAMAKSLEVAFGRGVAFQPSYAGSGPEGLFQQLFPDMEQAYSGFGPPESRIHAPNEYIIVDDYLSGIESVVRLLDEYAKLK